MNTEISKVPIKNLRHTLKDLVYSELEKLPEILEQLEPMQRINIVCKLIPFVLPKVESVHYKENEPLQSFLED